MKKAIVKAAVLCTLALSLLLAGISAVSTGDTCVTVYHDGPHNGTPRP